MKTKYNIGDKVVYIDSNFKATRVTVETISTYQDRKKKHVHYGFDNNLSYPEAEVFTTVADAKAAQKKHFDNLLKRIK